MATFEPGTALRQPLGWPAGSVRALLALGVLGIGWMLVCGCVYGSRQIPLLTFVYLQYMMVLILAHYFAAHGKSIGKVATGSSALNLPGGTIRLVLGVGYLGLMVFTYLHRDALTFYQGTPDKPLTILELIKDQGVLLGLLIGAFLLGLFLRPIMRGLGNGTTPYWYQDVLAWLSLLAMGGLIILALIQGFINNSLQEVGPIPTDRLEQFLAAVIGFYFGARS